MIIRNIAIIQGDKTKFRLIFKNAQTHLPEDISLWTVMLTVKKSILDEDSAAIIQIIISPGQHDDPTHGKTLISLTGADTNKNARKYVYDIRVRDTEDPITLMQGDFNINLPVGRSI
jgi:hypothetical protein